MKTECTRGGHAINDNYWLLAVVTVIFAMCYTAIVMFLVYRCVLDAERNADPYTNSNYSTRQKNRDMSRRVMTQGFFYTAALFLTYISAVVDNVFLRGGGPISMNLAASILTPLQGFFNASIYRYPAFLRWRKKMKEKHVSESDYSFKKSFWKLNFQRREGFMNDKQGNEVRVRGEGEILQGRPEEQQEEGFMNGKQGNEVRARGEILQGRPEEQQEETSEMICKVSCECKEEEVANVVLFEFPQSHAEEN